MVGRYCFFQGYWQQDKATEADADYVADDTRRKKNEDGSISFIGRGDDIIRSFGYRIGSFDVESAFLEHSAVIESVVVGKLDSERTELVKAFVVLAKYYKLTAALTAELQQYVEQRLAVHSYLM